jgi:4-hydroxyacetophenone monooxygenase
VWIDLAIRQHTGIPDVKDEVTGMTSLGHPDVERTGALVEGNITLTEEQIRTAVWIANVPALLMLLFQVTGEERWLEKPYLPTRGKGLGDHDHGGLSDGLQGVIREAAVSAIADLQAGKSPAIPTPTPETFTRMMSVCMGEEIPPEYGEMLSSEFTRRVTPDAVIHDAVEGPPGFKVVLIGSGVAGIAGAHQLDQMGIDYVVLDKQPEAGGNWWQNTYPGCGVDTPSHLYSFSFAQNDWTKHFELRDNIQHYFHEVISALGVREHIRFGVDVKRATYLDEEQSWELLVRNEHGDDETIRCNAVISAVGVLNKPRMLNIPGMGTFEGLDFHSAQWPADVDLTGKRVAIVGTGASSMQIAPAIAGKVESLTIFQRSPQWVAPFHKFQQPIPHELRLLLQSCTIYRGWYWLRLFWQFGDKVIEALRVDPQWPHPERAVNARNDGHRKFFTKYINDELRGREDLLSKVLPDYPPFGKRILLDNGWYASLRRDNVELVTEGVAAVRTHGLSTESGVEHEFDVIIWATGFEAAKFLQSIDVYGCGGVRLRDIWEEDNPRAYLGVGVPEFPNFFMLGGPNSFPGSGSFMYFMEVQMRYIRGLMEEMFRNGYQAIDPTAEANEKYNALVDDMHERTVWTHPGMSTYYRNSRGRVVFVMPFLNLEYWQMTQRPDMENYSCR